MGCGSCGKDGLPKGCKNNGSCGVKGCEKLTVFDWLSDMELPSQQEAFDCVEVRFKNGRKEYFKNLHKFKLYMGDVVAVEASPGHDIGAVSLTGELVRLQMKKRHLSVNSPAVKKLYRKANQRDIDLWREAQSREQQTLERSRYHIDQLGLDMKLSDVEFQGDNSKATFYYIADQRVDFRELIRVLAGEFRIRVEMRQIGSRQEAAKIGGIGSCGRELCCSTWLTDFRSVNTSAARYQQLSLNPTKLAGQCGKLKCCLNFELDSYLDALQNFPKTEVSLQTVQGEAVFQKMDIFKELMWYAYRDNYAHWIPLKLEDVQAIIAQNEKGGKPESLELYDLNKAVEKQPSYENVVGQDELTRFDHLKRSNGTKRKARPRKSPPSGSAPSGSESQGNGPQAKKRRPPRRGRGPASRPKPPKND